MTAITGRVGVTVDSTTLPSGLFVLMLLQYTVTGLKLGQRWLTGSVMVYSAYIIAGLPSVHVAWKTEKMSKRDAFLESARKENVEDFLDFMKLHVSAVITLM